MLNEVDFAALIKEVVEKGEFRKTDIAAYLWLKLNRENENVDKIAKILIDLGYKDFDNHEDPWGL